MAANPDKELADNLEQIRADIAALAGTVSQLVSDTAGIQTTLKKKATQTAKQAAAAGERLMDETMEMGNEALSSLTRQATAAVDNVEGQISKNPMTSVLVAVGLGFVLGMMTRK
jgi:ElaB/YqjD/DUF883 family membrane-anchored ribosome-binding protein